MAKGMTVSDLIDRLRRMPTESRALLYIDTQDDYYDISEVKDAGNEGVFVAANGDRIETDEVEKGEVVQ